MVEVVTLCNRGCNPTAGPTPATQLPGGPSAAWHTAFARRSPPCTRGSAYVAEHSELRGFGGGLLEQLRRDGGAPSSWASPWECRAARGRQARPEEAQGPISAHWQEGGFGLTMLRRSASASSLLRQRPTTSTTKVPAVTLLPAPMRTPHPFAEHVSKACSRVVTRCNGGCDPMWRSL